MLPNQTVRCYNRANSSLLTKSATGHHISAPLAAALSGTSLSQSALSPHVRSTVAASPSPPAAVRSTATRGPGSGPVRSIATAAGACLLTLQASTTDTTHPPTHPPTQTTHMLWSSQTPYRVMSGSQTPPHIHHQSAIVQGQVIQPSHSRSVTHVWCIP
jgi:hypothetical protein